MRTQSTPGFRGYPPFIMSVDEVDVCWANTVDSCGGNESVPVNFVGNDKYCKQPSERRAQNQNQF